MRSGAATGFVAALMLLAMLPAAAGLPAPADWERTVVRHASLAHPSHVLPGGDRLWVADVLADAVFEIDGLPPTHVTRRAPPSRRLASPHFLAWAPDGSLLATEGWGSALAALDAAGGWRRFTGRGEGFSAPHGVCVDDRGWIHVADSLHSRLVRFRNLDGEDWQEFADSAARVGYARQVVCAGGALYVANSYPDRPGIHAGSGGNVLRIDDWDSGEVAVELEFPGAHVTGVWPLDARHRLVSLWRTEEPLVLCRVDEQRCEPVPLGDEKLGIAYGIYFDPATRSGIVAFIGSESPGGEVRAGGLLRFRIGESP